MNTLGWVKSKDVQGPSPSGYFTAGINVPIPEKDMEPRVHFYSIQFYAKDPDEAVRRRDMVLALVEAAHPSPVGQVTHCPVCNETFLNGEFCDDPQCPISARRK